MDKKIIFGIAIFAVLASAIGLMMPAGNQQHEQIFPWQIEVMQKGTTRVFGLNLGESTLQQAEEVFGSITELSLFEPAPGMGQRVVEAYFDRVNLGGLSAKVVAVMAFTPEQLKTIFERGSRISTLGDGSRKVSLSSQDVVEARSTPIETITYLPGVHLDDALLEKRFGKPEQIITEKESSTRHWLYPTLGLDIAVDENNKAVLQYIAPVKFSELVKPLQ